MPLRLKSRRIEKPWGRRNLAWPFGDPSDSDRPIGEIIFDAVDEHRSELLVKFLFTSEKLSIQVHPDDRMAKEQGLPRGKDEAWLVLEAEEDSTIGLGLQRPVPKEALRAAALDGSIEALVDWRPVRAGDAFYSPAGTIHAIGAGLSLLEIQQNNDVTYRLYDYGRPRELHLDQSVEAARTEFRIDKQIPLTFAPGQTRLAGGPAFQVEQLSGPCSGRLAAPEEELWLIAISGTGRVDGGEVQSGGVLRLEGSHELSLDQDSVFVIAYPGATTLPVWQTDGS